MTPVGRGQQVAARRRCEGPSGAGCVR